MQDAIYNSAKNPPLELLRFEYRKLFGLTAAELDQEPADQFFTNLAISAYIQDKVERLSRNG